MLTNSILGGNVYKCLQISGMPASLANNGLKSQIDVPINPNLVEDCHRLPSKDSPKSHHKIKSS